MRRVTVAEYAGFCFGVKRATDRLEQALRSARSGERIYTLGHLIHNETYNESLRRLGVEAVEGDALVRIAQSATADALATVLVRAHGCTKETVALLDALAKQNPSFRWIDCTCPFVKKIHQIAQKCDPENEFFVLLGAAEHPEVVGIMSYFDGEKYVVSDENTLDSSLKERNTLFGYGKIPVMAAQTTQNLCKWNKSQKNLKKLYTNAILCQAIHHQDVPLYSIPFGLIAYPAIHTSHEALYLIL
jgi:4-hydroxy-3-methylbut-2-enyl diphosphate reductase